MPSISASPPPHAPRQPASPLGYPQRHAPYSSYEKFDFKVPHPHRKRRLRPLPRPHRMRCASLLKICQTGASKACPPARISRRSRPSIVLPGSRKDEDADGSAHLSLQDRHRRLRRPCRPGLPGRRIAARRDGLPTSSPTAPPSPTAYTCATPPSPPCRHSRTMCKGRLLADVVAVIGSIDIVLGEIDR